MKKNFYKSNTKIKNRGLAFINTYFRGIPGFRTLGSLFFSYSLFAKCDFSKEKEPLKSFLEAYKKSEKLMLGEPISSQKEKGVELIYRAKTKSWKGFDWSLRPLEFFAVMAAQSKYFDNCESKLEPTLLSMIDDFNNNRIPHENKKDVLHMLFTSIPCLEDAPSEEVQKLGTSFFQKYTEDFVTVLVGAESESTRYAADYKACSDKALRKNAITDYLVEGIEKEMRKSPLQKSLLLRLKRLRASKMHYQTAQYFFGKIDKVLINSAEN